MLKSVSKTVNFFNAFGSEDIFQCFAEVSRYIQQRATHGRHRDKAKETILADRLQGNARAGEPR